METLTIKNLNKTINSIDVAKMVEKEHNQLLKDIRRYLRQFNEGNIDSVDFFIESIYKDNKGELRPCYEITRKGCEFIANKLTGVKGTLFTAKYINIFHSMEEEFKGNVININLRSLTEIISLLTNTIQTMQTSITDMQMQTARTNELLIKLMENSTKKEKFKHNEFPEWINKMMPKFSIIKNYYFPEDKGYKKTYAKIFFEFNCTYGINVLSDALEKFCYQNNCKQCGTMDMVAYTPEIRTKMESIINNIINQIIELKRNESNK